MLYNIFAFIILNLLVVAIARATYKGLKEN